MNENELITELYLNYYDYLVKWCRQYVGGRDSSLKSEAEDIVQSVFRLAIEYAQRSDTFRTQPNHIAWLTDACKNRIGNAAKRNQRKERHTAFSLDSPDAPELKAAIHDLEESILAGDTLERIYATLTEAETAIRIDFFDHGMTMKDIATKHSKPVSAIKSTIRRIRKKGNAENYFLPWYPFGFCVTI